MFEDQIPKPIQPLAESQPKVDDIFAGVDNSAARPLQQIPQPQFNPLVTPGPVPALPEEENDRHGKIIMLAGGVVVALLVLAVVTWVAMIYLGNKKTIRKDSVVNIHVVNTEAKIPVTPSVPTPPVAPVSNLPVVTEVATTVTEAINTTTTSSGGAVSQISATTSVNSVVASTTTIEIDTDHDGLNDKEEAKLGTNPLKADTDGDGLNDYDEVKVYGTDPLKADTDGDGYSDGVEVRSGHNPNGPGKLIIKATSSVYENQ